ncbi:MAG: EAL domain-containing protein [Chromatiaceae bacterium]|nr:EAL domain-containing protein [Chromatiaceae bacterium]
MRWFRLPRFSVAQRIHLSFVLAAALPLLLLASGAYYLVSTRLEQVALDNARELAKSLGMDVFERLQFVTDQMTLIVARGAVDDAVRTGLDGFDLGERVRAFFQVHANGVVNGAVPFSGDEQVVLTRVLGDAAADKPLLFATGPSARRRLFMLVHDADGYLGAELSLRHLWDTAGVAARPERVCVLDVERQPIFCNHADHAAWLAASDSLIARRDEPRPVDHASGEVMLTAAWSLFLKPYYQFERWTVLVGIPRSLAFAAIASFGRVFAGGAVVALLFAFLFGRRLIRSNLEPLDSLGAATRRLAAGEFDYRVQLHTGDEFEQLGQAFDGMAERIGTQFRQLDALGRLDRALQAARSIDEAIGIAARVLDEMLGETRCALVCHERWQTPGEVWCVGFSSDRVETCSAPEARVPVLDLAASVGIAPRDPAGRADPDATPVRHPVIETEVVAALIVVRDANHDREIVGRVADVLGIALSNLAMERRLFHQANHDWLSGLPNRTSLRDRFITWSGYSQGSRAIGMLLIGLDRFKQVNDSMGHGMGDKLLKAVGWRLRAILPSGAILGRFSGDQFLLMMVDESQRNLVLQLEQLSLRIAAELDRAFGLGARELRLSASMGGAVYPRDAANFEGMLQCLDAAGYAAKASRRGGMLFFSPGMRERLVGRMDVEQALKGAVANHELVLHYQPVIDATTGRVASAEALMRWERPGVGLVMPGAFIEVAEDSGLIAELGRWALGEVCRQMVAWTEEGLVLDTLNVNVSSVQLAEDDFEDSVAEALAQSGLDPHRLTLEVTETALIGRFEQGVERLRRLRELGVRIMIDDFGTGYASLKYLKMLPIDGLKIDRLFVKDLPDSPADEAIVTAVVSLARASQFKLVAEGIETRAQAELLRDSGVPYLQGFLFAKGLAVADFTEFVRSTGQGYRSAVGSA